MHYHVIIEVKDDDYYGEYKTDLTKEQLTSRFIKPYEEGQPIIINGRTIKPESLSLIHI